MPSDPVPEVAAPALLYVEDDPITQELVETALREAGFEVMTASEGEWTSRGVPNSMMIAKPSAPAQIVVGISALLVSSDTAP